MSLVNEHTKLCLASILANVNDSDSGLISALVSCRLQKCIHNPSLIAPKTILVQNTGELLRICLEVERGA